MIHNQHNSIAITQTIQERLLFLHARAIAPNSISIKSPYFLNIRRKIVDKTPG
ncbi:MAG: hypothetical protein RID09_24905 [Coleofasciculus sp. G1-WW12-02]|uniref:hypothetical protein n=1 Tax=Coleofasciculus sp. G1-WW12-02 TaxID=3068483 RepID=UPI0033031C28